MILLSPHNAWIVLVGMVLGAKGGREGDKKTTKQHETPSVHPLLPVTNHTRSHFVTPPADLNSDGAGTDGPWVVWSGWDEAFAASLPTGAPHPVCKCSTAML